MFYLAEALLEGEGLSYSKHSRVIAAFSERFVRPGRFRLELHRFLIDAMKLRHKGDYEYGDPVTAEQAAEQIAHAELFLREAEQLLADLESSGQSC
jgi:uncharacterized protein (UPF0332 family)